MYTLQRLLSESKTQPFQSKLIISHSNALCTVHFLSFAFSRQMIPESDYSHRSQDDSVRYVQHLFQVPHILDVSHLAPRPPSMIPASANAFASRTDKPLLAFEVHQRYEQMHAQSNSASMPADNRRLLLAAFMGPKLFYRQ